MPETYLETLRRKREREAAERAAREAAHLAALEQARRAFEAENPTES